MATSAAFIDLDEAAAPATPATGKVRIYAKTDGSAYQKDDAGTETGLAAAAGAVDFAYVTRSTTQSITSGAGANIGFDTDVADASGYHDPVTNNDRLTVPSGKAGVHIVGASIMWDANATGQRQVFFRVNGTTAYGHDVRPGSSSFGIIVNATSPPLDLAVGDYVEVRVFQDSGGNRTIQSSQPAAAWITRIGD